MWSDLLAELAVASVDPGATSVDREYIAWIQYVEARNFFGNRSAELYPLALLGLVHGDAWRRCAKRFCRSVNVDAESVEKLSHTSHRMLGFKADFGYESVLKSRLWKDVTDSILQIPSIANMRNGPKAAETELIRRINESGIDLSSMDLRVPIRIECDMSYGNLQHVMMLAMAQAARQLPTRGDHELQRFRRHAAFRLHEVLLGWSGEMGWNELQHAKTIVQCGVRLCVLPQFPSTLTAIAWGIQVSMLKLSARSHEGLASCCGWVVVGL